MFLIPLFRVFIYFARIIMYLSQSVVTILFFALSFALFIFRQIGSGLILAMWTRAICNSCRFIFLANINC